MSTDEPPRFCGNAEDALPIAKVVAHPRPPCCRRFGDEPAPESVIVDPRDTTVYRWTPQQLVDPEQPEGEHEFTQLTGKRFANKLLAS